MPLAEIAVVGNRVRFALSWLCPSPPPARVPCPRLQADYERLRLLFLPVWRRHRFAKHRRILRPVPPSSRLKCAENLPLVVVFVLNSFFHR